MARSLPNSAPTAPPKTASAVRAVMVGERSQVGELLSTGARLLETGAIVPWPILRLTCRGVSQETFNSIGARRDLELSRSVRA